VENAGRDIKKTQFGNNEVSIGSLLKEYKEQVHQGKRPSIMDSPKLFFSNLRF